MQDEYKATPYQDKKILQKGANQNRKNQENIMKANDHWNDWKFKLY